MGQPFLFHDIVYRFARTQKFWDLMNAMFQAAIFFDAHSFAYPA
jgi:hypothetical protein